jgi:hypothetical protein
MIMEEGNSREQLLTTIFKVLENSKIGEFLNIESTFGILKFTRGEA